MVTSPKPPSVIERVRAEIRTRHYSHRTEEAYVHWVRRYIVFGRMRHPSGLGATDVSAFLASLSTEESVSASTQNQAFSAVMFLYRDVLRQDLGLVEHVPRAKEPSRVPVVLSVDEVRVVLGQLTGVSGLVGSLLYGAGLRLNECLELRVKDIDFERLEITIRRGKGQKDRRVMLPERLVSTLRGHLDEVRALHASDLAAGYGRVVLPGALDRKFPAAPTEWRWQFVFPAGRICRDPRFGAPTRTVQELLGHADVTTTMIYTHVLNRGGLGVKSPIDRL